MGHDENKAARPYGVGPPYLNRIDSNMLLAQQLVNMAIRTLFVPHVRFIGDQEEIPIRSTKIDEGSLIEPALPFVPAYRYK